MTELLKTLCLIPGATGDEEKVREFIRAEAEKITDDISEDSIGNLYVFKKGKKRREKPLMVCAHMDEVGIIIREICDDGCLRFDFVGGVDTRVVIGQRVFVGDKGIPGVIGMKAVHLTTREERATTPKVSSLFIDIGCEKKAKAEKLVSPGDFAVFDSAFTALSENRIKAKALDDRFGCAIMLKLLSEELEYDTHFVFTVQEEAGCRGANSAAYKVRPAFALILEATTAGDIPTAEGAMKVCAPGKGAVIGCMDGMTIYDKRLFSLLRSFAEEKNIPWQIKSRIAGGTDAGVIHPSRGGVRVTSLSLATRYIHTPSSVGDMRDIDAILSLSREFINCEEEKLNA